MDFEGLQASEEEEVRLPFTGLLGSGVRNKSSISSMSTLSKD
jgi:hypothetical protein